MGENKNDLVMINQMKYMKTRDGKKKGKFYEQTHLLRFHY